MDIMIKRPMLREVNGKDRPRPIDMHIKAVDNGYILTAGWFGGQQTLIAHSLREVSEWLNNWENMNNEQSH
jgi:hypothetical protein